MIRLDFWVGGEDGRGFSGKGGVVDYLFGIVLRFY